ncbi:hypothetical protein NADFUDRAFT_79683 [Nadsonia fulvescens var. elongata DSM 6958]|uniref:TECPR1-like DysF domain-containing protein n=1 Tax=Nadsonia fulvescens var. elongata DSM 6958 TaxID=857566 RepID=A0A1E3PHC4_9ASCO|nr:hypothetical protein NADFUDRAFT_79683 [Nadsonia fulvescens var. elongata DSM 6958]
MSSIFSWESLSGNRSQPPETKPSTKPTEDLDAQDDYHSLLKGTVDNLGIVTTQTNGPKKCHDHSNSGGQSHSRSHSLSGNNSPAIAQLMRSSTTNSEKESPSSTAKPIPTKNKESETTPGSSFAQKMLEKFFASTFPPTTTASHKRMAYQRDTQPFSVPILTYNFRNLNSRIGVVFGLIYGSKSFSCWENPCFTLSVMLIYTLVILNIHLLPLLPIGYLLFKIMTPAYVSRHFPDSHTGFDNSLDSGPPLADSQVPGPVPELSREFYMNLVDIQNLMPGYTVVFDKVLKFLNSFAYFKDDESVSSFVFVLLTLLSVIYIWIGPIIIQWIPWKFLFISGAWVLVLINHPKANQKNDFINKMAMSDESINISISSHKNVKVDVSAAKAKARKVKAAVKPQQLHRFMEIISKQEFSTIFCEPSQQREVEIFELQLFNAETNQWKEPHIFTSNSFVPSWIQAKALLMERAEHYKKTDSAVKDDHPSNNFESGFNGDGPTSMLRRTSVTVESMQVVLPASHSTVLSTAPKTIYFPKGKGLISEILPPPAWKFVGDIPWKLDLYPENWVKKDYGAWKDELRIDNDEKWVYDNKQVISVEGKEGTSESAPNCAEVAEPPWFKCRRRRWVRVCMRKKEN